MPKRKREEAEEGQGIKQRRVQHKLKLGVAKLGHAFKVSKGFERQKLGRRKKNAEAESNAKDVHRIESEIAALKVLDTTASAQQHLFKSLLKVKAVAEHPSLPPEVEKAAKSPADAATLNVIARLCKSNQVQEALSIAIDDIRRGLGLNVDKAQTGKRRRLRAKDFASQPMESLPDSRDRKNSTEPPSADDGLDDRQLAHVDVNDEVDVLSDEEGLPDPTGKTLASVSDHRNALDPRPGHYSLEDDLSISGSESEVLSASPEPQKATVTTKSSFLPSLSMAGYISGSESEAEDIDMAPRKNRRGQRARQQIWEKKYGENAKHLQKPDQDVRWDSRRGAVDGNERRHGDRSQKARPENGRAPRRQARRQPGPKMFTEPLKRQPTDRNAPIHPSWEAAKKAKEKREGTVAFQGRKTTFD